MLQIPKCKFKRFQSSVTIQNETHRGNCINEEIEKQKLEAHYSYMAKDQEVTAEESSSQQVTIGTGTKPDDNDVFCQLPLPLTGKRKNRKEKRDDP
ncbi:hypothetical protein Tco_0434537 [Tanacetum coccineum]